MEPRVNLNELCRDFGLLAVYAFGSRANDGVRRLGGQRVEAGGSDLDIGFFGLEGAIPAHRLGALQSGVEELFTPLRIDLVPLDLVDPIFQFRAISGERIAETDSRKADEKELEVMRRAADLLPFQRQLEREMFGVSTS